MNLHSWYERARRGCRRRAARWFGRRPYTIPGGRAIVSFSFDDFPRSALVEGGRILDSFNVAATYYTSLGLAGQSTPCGKAFELGDLRRLLDGGHELGCHTFDHCPAWTTPSRRFEASVIRNAQTLQEHVADAQFRSLSYPISVPRPATKNRVGRYFGCCRGGGQTYNLGTVDLNNLSAFFLEQSADRPGVIRDIIGENATAGGWLIFATHDISEQPTRFGCTPRFFHDIVQFAVDSGAEILPVGRAWDELQSRVAPRK